MLINGDIRQLDGSVRATTKVSYKVTSCN